MKAGKFLLVAAVAALILQACDGYKTTDGLKYKIHTENEGEKIKEGDYIVMNMIYRTDSDSVLYNTYTMGEPAKLIVGPPQFKGDLMQGLLLLAENDSATFFVDADSLLEKTFRTERPPFIAAGSKMRFDIKVVKVTPKAQMEKEMKEESEKQMSMEKANVDKYIADKKLTPVTTSSGLMYIIRKDGKGEKPATGDTVVVHYEGKLLNGNKFDSSYDIKKPFEFPVGQGQVIRGWDEGIMLLNKGSKATLIIPSSLAYGQQEVGNGAVPAYSTLVFDVELINIKKAK